MASNSATRKPKAQIPTVESILADVRAGQVKPVYLLMGEEHYFLDRIESGLVHELVPEELRDWTLITLFGAETDVETVVTTARGFPMGGDRLVVVVKEAQNLEEFARLETYLAQPQPTTVLIITYRNGTVDKRLKVVSQIKKVGLVYETPAVYENNLPTFVRNYVKEKQLTIDPDATMLLAQHVGTDLARLTTEVDKLAVALPQGQTNITSELVALHIGVSKKFNVFELTTALGQKNGEKAYQIAKYFANNPKENPIQRTLPVLFRYFQNVFIAKYSPDKSERGLSQYLGMSDWQVRNNILPPLQHYSGRKVMNILTAIRRTDARSKGIDNPSTPDSELLKELLFYILN